MIREVVEYYDPRDKALWSQGSAPWLVTSPAYRFKYCRVDDNLNPVLDDPYDFARPHYFTTAWFIHKRQSSYDMFWHERYKLAQDRQSGKYAKCNAEIAQRLGAGTVAALRDVDQKLAAVFGHLKPKPNSLVEFKDPDVVAFRGPGTFAFYEVKGERESFQFLQLESLAILQTLVADSEVAVVRMIEQGRQYTPQSHGFSFRVP